MQKRGPKQPALWLGCHHFSEYYSVWVSPEYMDNIPPSPPDSDPSATNWFSTLRAGITSSTSFLKIAAKEWIPFLLDQPTAPPFEHDAQFGDESGRIARLLTIVILVYLSLIGSLRLATQEVQTGRTVSAALTVFIVCILVALAYKPLAFLCGVRIHPENSPARPLSLRQVAFTTLYIFVPWLPIFAFIRTWFFITDDPLQFILLIAHLICFMYVIFNFAKAIRLITNSPRYRIWTSILLLLIALLILIILSKRM